MEKQISIIIPTYNMEAYIGKCLDSLLIPEFDQVEVWVVNDGSKDRSSEIAHSYANCYPGSIRVIDKPNGNYGSCINIALPLCSGRYIKVLDADDTFDSTAFSMFVQELPKCNEDVLITNFAIVNEQGKTIKVVDYGSYFTESDNKVLPFITALDKGLLNEPQMHSITYNNKLFNKFNYKQTEGISFTDSEWASNPYAFAKSIKFVLCGHVYRYLIGREGQTIDPSRFDKQIDNYLKVFSSRLSFMESQEMDSDRLMFLKKFLLANHCYIYSRIYSPCSDTTIQAIVKYDLDLKEGHKDFFDYLGDNGIYPLSKFKFIKKWRETFYKMPVSLPQFTRLLISIKSRFHL